MTNKEYLLQQKAMFEVGRDNAVTTIRKTQVLLNQAEGALAMVNDMLAREDEQDRTTIATFSTNGAEHRQDA